MVLCLSINYCLVVLDLKDVCFLISLSTFYTAYTSISSMAQNCINIQPLPRLFTKCMTIVIVYLQTQSCMIFSCLNDWLIKALSKDHFIQQVCLVLSTCQRLGFVVNKEKSRLEPYQHTHFIGDTLDTSRARVLLSIGVWLLWQLYILPCISASNLDGAFQHFLSLMASTTAVMHLAWLCLRFL